MSALSRTATAVGVFAWAASSSALASDPAQLLVEKRCNACHHATSTLIGPPYVAIALRHAPEKETMVDVLARKILLGGGGNWGPVPMVPNEHVSLDEAREMARWILEVRAP